MRCSILQNVYIFVDREMFDYTHNAFWHCLDNDYAFGATYNSLRTTLLKRV